MKGRLVVLLLALLAWTGAVGARLHRVQVVDHDKYIRKAGEQQQRDVTLVPPRGAIVDANGRELALSVAVDSVFALPQQIDDPQAVAGSLAETLRVDREALAAKLTGKRRWVWVARQLDPAVAAEVRERDHRGIGFVQESKRFYPMGPLAGPVLGFVGTDHTGLGGLEAQYNGAVSGEPVRRTLLNDALNGRVVAPGFSFIDAEPGAELQLNLDAGVQYIVERELARAAEEHNAKSASAVFLDPASGAILAMASYPAFDPNRFSTYPKNLWRNRPAQDAYEPGSTFKMVTAAAVLERNLVDPMDVFDCEMGAITLERTRIRDHKPFGLLTFGQVIAKSSNVGSIKAGLLAGKEGIHEQIRALGFGSLTGVDLPGENSGIVRPLQRWARHEVAYASIGHGVSVTVLQLARAFAAVANGGYLVEPHVVKAVGGRAQPGGERIGPVWAPATARTLLRLLEAVVEEGTGRKAAVPGYRVAGKTGTAQKALPGVGFAANAYVASFAGFAPSRSPRIVGVIALDEPQGRYHGGDVAAPVFAAILRQALPLLRVPTEDGSTPWAPQVALTQEPEKAGGEVAPVRTQRAQSSIRDGRLPDFSGLSARQAIHLSAELGLRPVLEGNGFVRAQMPPAGVRLQRLEDPLHLWLATEAGL